MKTALLHYWLTNVRGGEKVLSALAGLLPEADIFTHAYRPERMEGLFATRRVAESFIARLPLGRRHPQAYLPLMPLATRRIDLSAYDLVVSSESGPIKGIRRRPGQRHVCYCHTPMRYLWDLHDEYYRRAGLAGRLAMRLFTPALRRADLRSAESVDAFVANSAFVAERIRRLYGRAARVVHPPAAVEFFSQGSFERKDYYLLAGELVVYKRPDLALAACRRLGRRLIVAGTGRMLDDLRRMAGPGVTFLGRVDDATLRRTYAEARALIFPGLEDFGLVPVEAQAAGTPVIAYGRGGALETVVENETGVFFPEQSVSSLCSAIESFESRTWSPDRCRTHSRRFSLSSFTSQMREILF